METRYCDENDDEADVQIFIVQVEMNHSSGVVIPEINERILMKNNFVPLRPKGSRLLKKHFRKRIVTFSNLVQKLHLKCVLIKFKKMIFQLVKIIISIPYITQQ